MFTGIITDIGTLKAREQNGDSLKITIEAPFDEASMDIGCSISCSGICLTVIEKGAGFFVTEVSPETIAKTNISNWEEGSEINLERALKAGDELGGHVVSGHVDCASEVLSVEDLDGGNKNFSFKIPEELKKYVAEKGSITIDGVSLTVNEVSGDEFKVNIIPHTLENTIFKNYKKGSLVNLEIDMLARYAQRLLEAK